MVLKGRPRPNEGSVMERPSTSKDKGADLPAAKEAFESNYSTPLLKIKIEVRRRKRGVKHVAEDVLFVVSFLYTDSAQTFQ